MPITQYDLTDHPDSIWNGLSTSDYYSLLNSQEMEVYKQAEAAAAEICKPMAREAYLGLYDPFVDLQPPATDGQLSGLHRVMESAVGLPEWQSLRQVTSGDEGLSALGSATFVKEIYKNLPEEVKARMKEQQQAQDEVDNLQNALGGMQMPGGGSGSGNGQKKNGKAPGGAEWKSIQDALEKAKSRLNAANQAVNQALDKNSAQMKRAGMNAAGQAGKDIEDAKNTASAMGWGQGTGQLSKQDISNAGKLMEFLKKSKHLKKIVEMLGWANQLAASELKKKLSGRQTLVEYHRKPLDLETIVEDELVLFGLPADNPLAMDLAIRIASDEVLHAKYEDENPAGKGDLVILKDTSGSTSGDPFAIETAIEYVIMQHILKEKRRFISIPFSGNGQWHVYDPGPTPNLDEMLKHLEFGYFGVTEPYGPLLAGAEIIESGKSLHRADIVIITDGAFGYPPPQVVEKLKALRKKPGLRVVAVVIGDTGAAEEFCDRVIHFSSFQEMVREKDRMRGVLAEVL